MTNSLSSTVSELLSKLAVCETAYNNAKKDLNDVQKKLHGTLFVSRTILNRTISPVLSTPIKRGRGRPRKVTCAIETIDNGSSENINDDEVSSCETVVINDKLEDDSVEDNIADEFKGAVFTFISDGIYVETREGKFYDIYSLELRGWFNPYTQHSEWL